MNKDTYNTLIKVASDIFGAVAPQGAVYAQKTDEVRSPQEYDKVRDTKLPAFGDTRTVGRTVQDILNGNINAIKDWEQYGSVFKHQRRYEPFREFASTLPKQFNRGWVCLQGQSLCMPGQPFYLPEKGRHATTSELNQALNNRTKIPMNKGWNLFTLQPELEHSLDYNLPGMLHVSQWGGGLSGHAIMNAGNNSIYEFSEPGLVKSTAWKPRADGHEYAPWFRHTDDELYRRGWSGAKSVNTRSLVPLPDSISPEDAAGQFYSLFSTHPSIKGKDIISASEYAKLFAEANQERGAGSAYVLPSILRNSQGVRSANDRYPAAVAEAKAKAKAIKEAEARAAREQFMSNIRQNTYHVTGIGNW